MRKLVFIALISLSMVSCQEDLKDLTSVTDRKEEATEDLQDLLTDPPNGWKLAYRPTADAGTYLVLLDFQENGNVQVQSDLAADNGDYFDQQLTYRLDVGLGLEMIFETYGIFHYLFELDQASFGGEFEFLFVEEDGGELVFKSKSDEFDVTEIRLIPASGADLTLLSQEEAAHFDLFAGNSPRLFGGIPPGQQLYFPDLNYSIFWSIDLNRRNVFFDIAGPGQTVEEVLANPVSFGQLSAYGFSDGDLLFDNPITLNVDGQSIAIDRVVLGDFSESGGSELCAGSGETTPTYEATVSGQTAVISKSLFQGAGTELTPQADRFYSVNIPFIFDEELNSLAQEGSIADLLPNASAFIMTYGLSNDSIPENSVGFFVENEEGEALLYLRSFEPQASGNELSFSLTDEYYYEESPSAEEQNAMEVITDEIFSEGSFFAFGLPIEGITAFQLYNPCTQYELVLVK